VDDVWLRGLAGKEHVDEDVPGLLRASHGI